MSDAERLAAKVEAAWKEHSTGFSWPSEEAEYGEYRAFGAGYTLAAAERDAEKERADKAEAQVATINEQVDEECARADGYMRGYRGLVAERDALRARIAAAKKFATGERDAIRGRYGMFSPMYAGYAKACDDFLAALDGNQPEPIPAGACHICLGAGIIEDFDGERSCPIPHRETTEADLPPQRVTVTFMGQPGPQPQIRLKERQVKVSGQIVGSGPLTVGELKRHIAELPDGAQVRSAQIGESQLDGFSYSLKFEWDTAEAAPHPFCSDHNPVHHRDGKPPWCDNCKMTTGGVHKDTIEPFGRDKQDHP